jgi:sodium transport system permease protein
MNGNIPGAGSHDPRKHAVGNRWRVVLSKELREIFRDRRTTLTVIISPLLITPALFGTMGAVIQGQAKQTQAESFRIGIVTPTPAPTISQALAAIPHLEVVPVTEADAEVQIRNRHLRTALVLPEDTEPRLRAERTVDIRFLVDEGNDKSQEAAQRVREGLSVAGTQLVAARLRNHKLPQELIAPFSITEQPVPGGGNSATFLLSMFLPYVLALSAISGGLYAANDMVAGEKERGTLETLLVSPASRRELVIGKFMAVATVCLVSSFLSVVGLMLPFVLPIKAFAWLAKGGLHLSAASVTAILLVQLPLAILFAGLLLALSTFARNQREAQTYIGPLMLVVVVPAMLSMMLKSEASWTLALVPVLNATLVLKQALSSTFDPVFIAVATVASVAYAGLAILFATRLFENERVLLKAS